MKKKVDNLGRFVIPKELRESLDISPNDDVEFNIIDNKIIISKPDGTMSKNEIEELFYEVNKSTDMNEYKKGFRDALKMILRK